MLYRFLDLAFVVFHTILTLFNMLGWIFRKTRFVNLISLFLTGASWLILGWFMGTLGYCPLTDWHFKILEKLGKTDLPDSYIKYIVDRISGLDLNQVFVDKMTLFLFLIALLFSASFNIRDFFNRRRETPKTNPNNHLF